MRSKYIKKGEIIFREGDRSDYIYQIEKGKVRIFRKINDIEEEYAILGEGEIFGEMGVLSNSKRSAWAQAVEDTILKIICGTECVRELKNMYVMDMVVSTLIKRIKSCNDIMKFIFYIFNEIKIVFYMYSRFMEEETRAFTVMEIYNWTGIPMNSLKGYLKELHLRNIVEFRDEKVFIRNGEVLHEHLKYLFLKEKFDVKRKITSSKLYLPFWF
jgi:hypothetical protein